MDFSLLVGVRRRTFDVHHLVVIPLVPDTGDEIADDTARELLADALWAAGAVGVEDLGPNGSFTFNLSGQVFNGEIRLQRGGTVLYDSDGGALTAIVP